MMQILYSKNFLKSVKKLLPKNQNKLGALIEKLQQNPYHSLLHTKQLSGKLAGLLSFRITRSWRVIFKFLETETIQLLRVKHRADAYKI